MRTFASLEDFVAAKGESLGFSEWHKITQEQVNALGPAIARKAEGDAIVWLVLNCVNTYLY